MRIAAAAATLGLLLSSPALTDPLPRVPADMRRMMLWISQTHTWSTCPDPHAVNKGWGPPSFGVNGAPGPSYMCFVAGPFLWTNNTEWYVQLIDDLIPTDSNGKWDAGQCSVSPDHPCYDSYIRVCSVQYVGAAAGTRGPCWSFSGVGAKGCETCAASEDYVGRPGTPITPGPIPR
jgi:hypothetical protein